MSSKGTSSFQEGSKNEKRAEDGDAEASPGCQGGWYIEEGDPGGVKVPVIAFEEVGLLDLAVGVI